MKDDERLTEQLVSELNQLRQLNAALERQLDEQHAQLQAADQELEAFCHVLAHDLRAPLQLIIGYSNLLNDCHDELSEELIPHMQAIEHHAQRMDSLIDRLLAFTKQQQPPDEMIVAVDMGSVVEAALARLQNHLAEKNIVVEVAPALPRALGYASRIEQAFVYLIHNAIKYIGANNPDPRLTISGEQGEPGTSSYTVQDNGPGMTSEDQERLSEMLGQARITQTRGLNLEIFLAHHIITRLNGDMGVKSTKGEGSAFCFTLPAPS